MQAQVFHVATDHGAYARPARRDGRPMTRGIEVNAQFDQTSARRARDRQTRLLAGFGAMQTEIRVRFLVLPGRDPDPPIKLTSLGPALATIAVCPRSSYLGRISSYEGSRAPCLRSFA
jgi:hypothetical protein